MKKKQEIIHRIPIIHMAKTLRNVNKTWIFAIDLCIWNKIITQYNFYKQRRYSPPTEEHVFTSGKYTIFSSRHVFRKNYTV